MNRCGFRSLTVTLLLLVASVAILAGASVSRHGDTERASATVSAQD